ncbi:NADP-dependent oxidoreductase [Lichenihabitans sp. PAMC28606]|uniref:NADP-dependent oxidoreductase n=1 Tax=Lichenihabitans sp. PAMC28606 TaxID=2880932 RepID=UPI001D0B1EF7|nr:NADP-dependent oxidoreductase [Lichenihabitans sp. PAMC28606]UDL94671.1 NADP-dependent oxidoreductase [Lichenihabitans sp. PAMC28606]
MMTNRSLVLDSRPEGKVESRHFRMVEAPVAALREEQVLIRNLFLSLDPYMRGRMSAAKSYAVPQEIGVTMGGGTVGEVVESRHSSFKPGDKVVGMGGWQLYAINDGAGLRKVDDSRVPLSAFLGVAGMPGVTAWYGLNKIIAPKPGETILVSAATGAVGSVVGQLAKAAGARAVGIAGGPDKCRYAVETLGYDACVDHKSSSFAADLAAALPHGIDGLFENVGGVPFTTAIEHLNHLSRVAICGLIASYQGAPTTLPNMHIFLRVRFKMEGFIVSDHLDLWPDAIAALTDLVANGKLTYRETIAEGLDAAPAAFIGLLDGQNLGKQLVKLV